MDRERIIRLLEEIKDSLKVAENIVSMDLEAFISDIRNKYTLRMVLVEIVEAATSLGLHILREKYSESEIEGYAKVFKILTEHGVVSRHVSEGMERLVRLRNLIVHRYWEVDDARLYREAKANGLDIIRSFIREVESYVFKS